MSSVNTQFSIAVHLLAALGSIPGNSATSSELSESVNACPSFVRRVLSKLSKANLVRTTTGKSGSCTLIRNPERINLLEVHQALDVPKPFAIHAYPNQKACRVSCGIKTSLETVLEKTTKAVERSLKETSLADVIAGFGKVG